MRTVSTFTAEPQRTQRLRRDASQRSLSVLCGSAVNLQRARKARCKVAIAFVLLSLSLPSCLVFLLLAVAALSCSAPGRQSRAAQASAEDAVKAVVAGIISADNKADLESVMSFYEKDAVLLPPENEPVYGEQSIRPRYQSLFDTSEIRLVSTSEETTVSGDWAFDRGYNLGTITAKGKGSDLARTVDDQYLMILHKQPSGSWKIARLMWHPRHKRVVVVNKAD